MPAFLEEHMMSPSVVRLGGGDYEITQTEVIDLPYPLTLRGFSYITTNIYADSAIAGLPMFRCLSDITFENLQVHASTVNGNHVANVDGVRFVGKDTYSELRNFYFGDFRTAILDSTEAEIWLGEGDIVGATSEAIKVQSAEDSVIIRMTAIGFINCDKSLNLKQSAGCYIDIDGGCEFRNYNVADSAIVLDSANFVFTNAYIHGTIFNNTGVFIDPKFDFSLYKYRNIYVISNAGVGDKSPEAKINCLNNTDTTLVTTAGTYYKAKYTNTSAIETKFKVENNKITYYPSNIRDIYCFVSLNVSTNGINKNVDVCIVKNGVKATPIGQMTVRCAASGAFYPIAVPITIPNITAGDYLEIWLTSSTNGDIVTVGDVSWLTNTK